MPKTHYTTMIKLAKAIRIWIFRAEKNFMKHTGELLTPDFSVDFLE